MLKTQRTKLRAKGILSIDQLAAIKPNAKIPGMNPEILERLRKQAAIQIKPRKNKNVPEFILKDQDNSFGLFNLPKPSQGDIWFDLEGLVILCAEQSANIYSVLFTLMKIMNLRTFTGGRIQMRKRK